MYVLLMFIKDDLDVCICLYVSCIMVVINFLNRLKIFILCDLSNEIIIYDFKILFNLDVGVDLF